jgi:hypothetical protein
LALDVYREWLKIQTPDRPPDSYTLLGLNRFEDDRVAIQKNYRQRSTHVRKYATGKFSKESQDLLDELARAMLTLTDPARKSEYDRKLGRKTKRPPLEKRPMGQILVDDGIISAEQLQTAQVLADELGIDLRQALVQKQIVGWEEATRSLAQQHNLPYLDLADQKVAPELIEKVPADLATRENLFPLLIDEENLLVAVTHERNLETLETLRFRLGMPVRAVLCSPPAIRALVGKHYSVAAKPATSAQAAEEAAEANAPEQSFSFAGWLWQNIKWLGVIVALVGGAAGYFVYDLIGALAGCIATLLVLLVVLFTAK